MSLAAARGCCLAFVGLVFGISALRYPIGALDRPGPGLFPLVVSAALLLLASVTLVAPCDRPGLRLELRWRNIAILLAALGGFVLVSRLVNVAAGTAVLVFTAGLAGRGRSFRRSLVLSAVLVTVAFGFERLLGLRLGVF